MDASSSGGPGWVDISEACDFAKEDPPVMETVGHVIYEVSGPLGWIAITDTLGSDECSTVHKIPNTMILEKILL